jgi:fructose-1,6-bisphosphatase
MAKKKKIPEKYQRWIDARKRFHLSHAHIQMARELGMNPKKFGSLANTRQEPWKLPLPDFIEELYFKHFKKNQPDNVRSIEQMVSDYNKKKGKRFDNVVGAPDSKD